MIVVSNYKKVQNAEGEDFFMLELQGEPELITSKASGRKYFTARTVNVAATFSESVCKSMIGKKMPGNIVKKAVESYFYTPPNSNDPIELDYTWEYDPSNTSMEEAIMMDKIF